MLLHLMKPVKVKILVVLDSSWDMFPVHRFVRNRMKELFGASHEKMGKNGSSEISIGLLACGYGVSPDGDLVMRAQNLAGSGRPAIDAIYEDSPANNKLFTNEWGVFKESLDKVIYQGGANHAVTLDTALDCLAEHSSKDDSKIILLISNKVSWDGQMLRHGNDRSALGLETARESISGLPDPAETRKPVGEPSNVPDLATTVGDTSATVGVPENMNQGRSGADPRYSAGKERSLNSPETIAKVTDIDSKAKNLGIRMILWNDRSNLEEMFNNTCLVFDDYLVCPLNNDSHQCEMNEFVNKFLSIGAYEPESWESRAPAQLGQRMAQPAVPNYRNESCLKPPAGKPDAAKDGKTMGV